jgi:hypothetical protein
MSGNHDLPILDELGAELARMLEADEAPAPSAPTLVAAPPAAPAPHPAPPPAPRRALRGGRRSLRVTRRVAVVLSLLCLVGGVALAARFAGSGDAPSHTSPALLGRAGGGAWHVSAYRDEHRLCLLLNLAGGGLTSDCAGPPGPAAVWTTSLRAEGRRFVAGLAGPRVAAVSVRSGGNRARVVTRAATDPGVAGEAGVPAGTRWFVVALPAGSDAAVVTPLDGDRRRLGSAFVDCSLGVFGPACRAQVRAAATAAEDRR